MVVQVSICNVHVKQINSVIVEQLSFDVGTFIFISMIKFTALYTRCFIIFIYCRFLVVCDITVDLLIKTIQRALSETRKIHNAV